jgi:hypothetical protein
MADILLDEQSVPSTPSAGTGVIWPDTATSGLAYRDDAGKTSPITGTLSSGTAAQVLGTADTVVTGSRVLVPSAGLQVGSVYHVRVSLSKNATGTAAPVWTVRLGTAGTTSDASQWTHTGVAQTAIAETGYYELLCTVRSIGASGVLQGTLTVARTGGTAATGLASVPVVEVSGAAADKTWASGQGLLLSINPGASSAWTVTQCVAELK